jgi:hypothetical protein
VLFYFCRLPEDRQSPENPLIQTFRCIFLRQILYKFHKLFSCFCNDLFDLCFKYWLNFLFFNQAVKKKILKCRFLCYPPHSINCYLLLSPPSLLIIFVFGSSSNEREFCLFITHRPKACRRSDVCLQAPAPIPATQLNMAAIL